jgi:hypothetical protein
MRQENCSESLDPTEVTTVGTDEPTDDAVHDWERAYTRQLLLYAQEAATAAISRLRDQSRRSGFEFVVRDAKLRFEIDHIQIAPRAVDETLEAAAHLAYGDAVDTPRGALVMALSETDHPMSRKKIASALSARGFSLSASALDAALSRLVKRGVVVRVSRGLYALPADAQERQ